MNRRRLSGEQTTLFAEPPSTLDELRALWSRTTEAERMEFLEGVRRHYLFGSREAGWQPNAKAPNTRGV